MGKYMNLCKIVLYYFLLQTADTTHSKKALMSETRSGTPMRIFSQTEIFRGVFSIYHCDGRGGE